MKVKSKPEATNFKENWRNETDNENREGLLYKSPYRGIHQELHNQW